MNCHGGACAFREECLHLCIIGTGCVGLATAAVFADLEHPVTCADTDPHKIKCLTAG